jgi:hypothetical protein
MPDIRRTSKSMFFSGTVQVPTRSPDIASTERCDNPVLRFPEELDTHRPDRSRIFRQAPLRSSSGVMLNVPISDQGKWQVNLCGDVPELTKIFSGR